MKTTKVQWRGRLVDAEVLSPTLTPGRDHIAFDLDDGASLEFRVLPADVKRLIGVRHPNGEPIYLLNVAVNQRINVPPHLMLDNS
jgi:hypothetical protein